jgi:hypothetical protein
MHAMRRFSTDSAEQLGKALSRTHEKTTALAQEQLGYVAAS